MARRGDKGSTHTLEAFVMLTIMFVAVVSVTDFTVNDTSAARIERMLTTKARDMVAVWNEMEYFPDDVCEPKSRLDELVLDGLKEDHSLWDEIVENNFGPGYDVDLVIDNYDAIYPLHGSGRVVGSTGIVDWTRDDTYVMPLSAVNSVSGTERVRIDAPAIHYGVLAKAKGEAVRYGANYTATLGDGQRTAWGLSAMLTDSIDDSERTAAAIVVWEEANDVKLIHDLVEQQIQPVGQREVLFFLRVAPAGTAEAIPAGTTINVTLPAGWRDASWYAETLAPWIDRSPPQPLGSPIYLVAEAGPGATAKTLQLQAFAPTDGARPFDVISARLSRGSLAESNLVVTYPIPDTDRSTPRILAPTTPYAMRAGNSFVFGAALANGGDPIRVTDFTIEIPGGYDLARHHGDGAPLFAGIIQEEGKSRPASGWEWVDARRVVWTAGSEENEVPIDALHAADFFVTIQLTSDPRHGTSVQPASYDGPNVTLEFENGHKVTSRSWGKSPGVVSFQVEPATRPEEDPSGGSADGYPWSASALATRGSRELAARSQSAVANVDRDATYGLRPVAADAVNFENAVANASFEVKTRKVPVGTRMRADGDLSSLLETLGQLGVTSRLTLELYSPPSLGCAPTASWEIDTTHLPTPAILQTLIWGAGQPTPSVFVTTADNYLYRLDATGAPVWATRLLAKPSSLERMDRGPAGVFLLVGGTGGSVESIEAVEGDRHWSRVLGGAGELSGSVARYDADRDVVIASGGGAISRIDPETGQILDTSASIAGVADIIPTAQGYHVRGTAARWLLDGGDLRTIETQEGVLTGLSANDATVIVSDASSARAYAVGSGQAMGTPVVFPRDAVKTTRGLATDDTIEDLVVGLDDGSIYVIDGATGALAWSAATVFGSDDYAMPPVALPIGESADLDCEPASRPAGYSTTYWCGGDVGSRIGALAAGGARAAIGKLTGGGTVIQLSGGADEWAHLLTGVAPTAASLGGWFTNTHALASGDEHGNVVLYDDHGIEIFRSVPSDRVGKFSFYMMVPEGGFYGTHLFVARLEWEHRTQDQEARLLDWFEVVSKSGEPIPRPAYRVALSVAQREGGDS